MRWSPAAWLSPITGWMLIFYALPVGYIFLVSFMSMENYRLVPDWNFRQNYWYILSQAMYHKAYLTSLWLSARVVILTTLIAYPLSYASGFCRPQEVAAHYPGGNYCPFLDQLSCPRLFLADHPRQ